MCGTKFASHFTLLDCALPLSYIGIDSGMIPNFIAFVKFVVRGLYIVVRCS